MNMTASQAQTFEEGSASVIAAWIIRYIEEMKGIPSSAIPREAEFASLGLESTIALAMTGDLSDWLETHIDPMAPYQHPTIDALSRALAAEPEVQARLRTLGVFVAPTWTR